MKKTLPRRSQVVSKPYRKAGLNIMLCLRLIQVLNYPPRCTTSDPFPIPTLPKNEESMREAWKGAHRNQIGSRMILYIPEGNIFDMILKVSSKTIYSMLIFLMVLEWLSSLSEENSPFFGKSRTV